MVASDLAASNAAGGQCPLHTAKGNMRSRCIFILVLGPKYIQYYSSTQVGSFLESNLTTSKGIGALDSMLNLYISFG